MTRGARSRERAIALVVAVLLAGTSAIGGPPPVRATEPTPSAPPTEILGAETPAPATTPEPLPTAEPTPAPPVETPAVATPPPVETPTPAPEPTATPDPTATPAPADVPGLAPLPPGATELVEKRTESSRTYLDATGRMTSQLYTEPVFYKPEGSSTLVPVEVGFRATDDPGTSAVSDRAPVAVSVAAPTSADGFLAVTAGGTRVAFALPADLARDASRAEPVVAGAVADYAEITPGVGLRVIAGAEGATSFFVWRAAPAEPTLRFVVEAPGLALALTKEGTIEARDAAGTLVGIIPRPYAVDSTPDPFAGSGRFTDRVSLALAPDGRTVTVAVDEGWLATATYPVYVDPTYYNAGSLSYGDAHIASGYPTQNFADYVRPDSPYYHELWLGTDPSGTSGASHDYLRWDVAPFAGTTIDTAWFAIYPYHQYYDAPATTPTWLRQVIEAPNGTWRETDPTWNNRSSYSYDLWTSEACVEGGTCTFNTLTVRTIVQGWATSPAANFGIRLDEAGCSLGQRRLPEHALEAAHRRRAHRSRLLQAQDDRHLARPERDGDRQARLHREPRLRLDLRRLARPDEVPGPAQLRRRGHLAGRPRWRACHERRGILDRARRHGPRRPDDLHLARPHLRRPLLVGVQRRVQASPSTPTDAATSPITLACPSTWVVAGPSTSGSTPARRAWRAPCSPSAPSARRPASTSPTTPATSPRPAPSAPAGAATSRSTSRSRAASRSGPGPTAAGSPSRSRAASGLPSPDTRTSSPSPPASTPSPRRTRPGSSSRARAPTASSGSSTASGRRLR